VSPRIISVLGSPFWLGLIAGVVACVAWSVWLVHPTFHAASFAFTAALSALLFAVLQLRFGRARAFWFGFVVVGGGYAFLAFAPGAWLEIRPYLLTSHPLGDLADALRLTKTSPKVVEGDLPNVVLAAGLNPWFATVQGDRFQRIGHSLAVIIHGVAGGVLAVYLERRNKKVGSAIADHPGGEAKIEDGPE
jgi:hypothetical protein